MEVEVGLSSANLSSHTRLDFNERNRIEIERRAIIPPSRTKPSTASQRVIHLEQEKSGLY